MYKIQKLQDQNWADGTTLRFNCEVLQDQIAGHPLHVAEVVVMLTLNVDVAVADVPGNLLPQLIGAFEVIPNEVCEASRLDGDAAHKLDHMLTGRTILYPDVIVNAGQQIQVMVRLPYHGCLLGAKVGNYQDALSPVRRFWRGNVNVRTAEAGAITNLTVNSGTVSVYFVTEPIDGHYTVGPMPVYDLFNRPAGPSFDWTSKGRLSLLSVCPKGPDDTSNDYDLFTIQDACWVQGLNAVELLANWQAMQTFGGNSDPVRGTNFESGFVPLLWNRPCAPKLWTNPMFLRGNRNVEAQNNSATEHRVVTAQLLTSNNFLKQLEVDVGRRALRPKVSIQDGDDAAKIQRIAPWLPRRIPIKAFNRVTGAIRRIAR